jgi:hypothetical protein
MKRATMILLPLTLALSGCDQNARDFATNAKTMLDRYAARIDREIAAESQYYQREAVLEVKHRHENLANSIKADRAERGSETAVELSGGGSPLRIRTYLRDYAQSEYTRRVGAWTGETDSSRQYLANLQTLQADKDRIHALGKLLDGLSSKKLNLAAEIGAATQAVSETKTDFDKLICDDVAAKLKGASGKDKESLGNLQRDRKCGGAR